MKKPLFLAGALFAISMCSALEPLPETWNEKMSNEWDRIEVRIRSSADGTEQPAYFHLPPKAVEADGKVPMLVMLHSWSYGYKAKNPASWAATECCRRGWAFLYPHFRGPNKTPQGCGSDLAVQDIADGVKWALANHPIDPERVYIMGGSGGGHMTLQMAGRHPELFAAAYAACPITDVARWYEESRRKLYPSYADMILAACGGTPAEREEEYRKRSPLTWITAAKKAGLAVSIVTGIHDGHKKKGGGSVPVGHSVRAYNALAADKDRISEVQIEEMERTEQVPAGLKFSGRDPYFRKGQDVLLRRTSGNVQLTIFNAGHAGNYVQGAAWLSLQRRGRPTEWNVPPPGRSTGKANEVTK
ncbi:MAG: alpha/beta fold hydrolase [Kiritimatiellae bacterium]|nr:alpha/beta fold hydrolase [Kiritimatiellia bacterium]